MNQTLPTCSLVNLHANPSKFNNVVMEYIQGGQLLEWDDNNQTFTNRSYTGFLPEENLRTIFNGVIEGLDYCKNPLFEHLIII